MSGLGRRSGLRQMVETWGGRGRKVRGKGNPSYDGLKEPKLPRCNIMTGGGQAAGFARIK